MLRKPRKAEQATEPCEQVQARNSRFQIVKLEERIAPSACRRGGCHGGGSNCHYNPQGNLVGNC